MVSAAKGKSRLKEQVLARGRGIELERSLAEWFEVKGKQDSKYEVIRREVYKKLDADNHPEIKKFLDEEFKKVYLGRFKDVSVDKFLKYTPQDIIQFERNVTIYNKEHGIGRQNQAEVETETATTEEKILSEEIGEESAANEKSKMTDPIEQRAREALKAAGLEGKTASEKLTPKEELARKVDVAVEKLTGAHNFSDEQNKWIDRFGKWIKNNGSLNVDDFNLEGAALKMNGGFKRFNKMFDGRLTEIIDELNGYVNEEATANVEESGTGERLNDGHRDVESAVREGTDEETRTQRRTENAGVDSGRERQVSSGLGENATRTNAENAQPVRENDTGSTSARTGERTGLRGNSETVQPAAGTERGNRSISERADNVNESEIEQRARKALKTAGLDGKGAFESQGISVKVQPISDGKIIDGKIYVEVSLEQCRAKSWRKVH